MSDQSSIVSIDPYKLEEEWTTHAQRVLNVGSLIADAQREFDAAKSELEFIRVDLDKEIRDNPKEFGLDKINETVVANEIIRQPDYRAAIRRTNEAKYQLGKLQSEANALEHRKRALTSLVELWIREYYSDPQHTKKFEELDSRSVRGRGRLRLRQEQEEDVRADQQHD